MESEIDELFLDSKNDAIDRNKIINLDACMNEMPGVYPNLRHIDAKCKEIYSSLELYTIKLESLSNELREVEDENMKLENEILYQTQIYEHLKELLYNVEIKEEHFIALEVESFDSIDGICKMERALDVLNGLDAEKYSIRIVREKKERINDALRKFYKRFIAYMGKFMAGNEHAHQLKVHKGLYGLLKRFRKIIEYSRKQKDYYAVVCSMYMAHSRKLYEREVDAHMKTMLRLIRDKPSQEKVNDALQTFSDSYRSIVQCEMRFLESMGLEGDASAIFNGVWMIVKEFVENVYELLGIETLNGLGLCWREVDEAKESVYFCFQKELRKMYARLEEEYLCKEVQRGDLRVEKLERILRGSSNAELRVKAAVLGMGRILQKGSSKGLDEAIRKWKVVTRVQTACGVDVSEIGEAEKKAKAEFERHCMDFILGEGNAVSNAKKVVAAAGEDEVFKSKMVKMMLEMMSSRNAEDGLRESKDVIEYLSKVQ
ncbi:exocyst complex component Sec3 [Ordospora pajunii]|uniref:exocyst complex component Sec3 n=1 Tax=Ordospora pajunii TaxID=3039483 RepID=UPI002952918F|nr:exocyst complex component Sec3 [Ordospora pajunii]KAH9411141.1 exocyst complex component Sec3 [Ordospora pajunii]